MFTILGRIARFPWTPLALAGAAGLALFDALRIEPDRLRVERVDVPVDDPTGRLVGVRVAQLSDLHVGGVRWRPDTITRAIDTCNQEDVDLIAITGDLIGRGRGASTAIELLSTLRSDVPRVAVLGNHDHVHGRRPLEVLLRGLQALGISLLQNEAIPVELSRGRLWLVGVDDGYSMRDDLEEAMRGLGSEDYPRLLLTHYPEVVDQLRPGEVQLSLAGHTHAGQIRLPVLTTLVNNGHARTSYGHGLYLVNGNPLYVTSGLGMSSVPMRFRNWPEVTILRFVAARRSPQRAAGVAQPSVAGSGATTQGAADR